MQIAEAIIHAVSALYSLVFSPAHFSATLNFASFTSQLFCPLLFLFHVRLLLEPVVTYIISVNISIN